MTRAIGSLIALAVLAGTATLFSGANFAVQTANPQTATAATDFVPPTVSTSVIATTQGGTPFDGPGFIKQGGTYRVYANVTDSGNPASGVASVTANLTNVSDGGHSAIALTSGSYTVGGVSYNYASAEQSAIASLAEGSYSYTVAATDNASNASTPASFSVTVDNTAPTISGSVIARTDGAAPGFLRQGDTYYVYANTSDSSSGVHAATADVAVSGGVISSGQTAVPLTTTPCPCTINGVTYAYRSAAVTADSALTDGAYPYTVTATDNVTNSVTSPTSGAGSFSLTLDSTAPTIVRSAIATTAGGTPIDGPGALRPSGTYRIYAEVTDAGSGVQSVAANVAIGGNVITTGQSSVPLTFNSTGVTVGGTTYHWLSAELTADSGLTQGNRNYTITATDNISNSTGPQAFSVFVDTTAPTVSLTSPAASTNVRATINPSATASDNFGVAFVNIQIAPHGTTSWSNVCPSITSGSPYTCSFDTTTVSDGLYDFRALATDKAGNTTTSATIGSVRVDNTPPVVTMADPGSPLKGIVTLSSSATDTGGSGVASVTYQYAPTGTTNWSNACTGSSGPSFSCGFDTSTVNEGAYDFRALATDNAGNVGTSATISNRQLSQPPLAVSFTTTNCVGTGCVSGEPNAGDTISFTYSRAINPGSLVPATSNPTQSAWDGVSPRNVEVMIDPNGSNTSLSEVELNVGGNVIVNLGSVNLGQNYATGSTNLTFSPSPIVMSNGGKTFTITLGSQTAGAANQESNPKSVVWTPSSAATDLAGVPISTTTSDYPGNQFPTRSFVAF